jgi:hypothetical protein
MTKWIKMTYTNGYGKQIKHHCSVKGLKDIKEVVQRYDINPEYITEFIVDDEIKDIEKVRESLK